MRWKDVTELAMIGIARIMSTRGLFTKVNNAEAVKALEIFKTVLPCVANTQKVSIGDQIGIQIT